MVRISSPECNRIIIQTAGPGIGTDAEAVSQLDALINGSGSKPLVLDADAMTIISSDAGRYLSDDLRRMSAEGRQIILTPHEGELHRLLKIVPDAPTDGDRLSLGIAVSEYFGCTVVAKGDVTYTITPGEDIVCNDDCGNSGMATAGSGDVLAGIITGLLAQGLDAHTAASYGVRIHALAGDRAAEAKCEHALMAGDIAEFIF